jgi:hypothetical protein
VLFLEKPYKKIRDKTAPDWREDMVYIKANGSVGHKKRP